MLASEIKSKALDLVLQPAVLSPLPHLTNINSDDYDKCAAFTAYLKASGINIVNCYIPARWAAAKTGLGKFGRNNFIYDPEHGSYIWVEYWVVDKEFAYDATPDNIYLSECGEHCEKCVRACPTSALSGGFSMDRGKCIAQLSYFAKELPQESTREQMGLWLYGCDACQDVCPCNADKFKESETIPQLRQLEECLKLENILMLDERTYIRKIHPRFDYIGKDGLWLWKCNALRAMINAGEKKYHGLIKQCCGHEDARIREMAQWGCDRLGIVRYA